MSLKVNGDDFTGCGERQQVRAKHFGGADTAMQQDQAVRLCREFRNTS